jgi:hypothetical protein
MHALAPSNRPVQATENPALFWRDIYPKLKQQLLRSYPKHDWRQMAWSYAKVECPPFFLPANETAPAFAGAFGAERDLGCGFYARFADGREEVSNSQRAR